VAERRIVCTTPAPSGCVEGPRPHWRMQVIGGGKKECHVGTAVVDVATRALQCGVRGCGGRRSVTNGELAATERLFIAL
jgi:hypothetical protein